MTETLEQSVKRTAEYPFLLLYEMRYSEAFGELAHLFFESMMDDDDGKGAGGGGMYIRYHHQFTTNCRCQLGKKALCFFSSFLSLV